MTRLKKGCQPQCSPINKGLGDNRWWPVLPLQPFLLPFNSLNSTLSIRLSQLHSLNSALQLNILNLTLPTPLSRSQLSSLNRLSQLKSLNKLSQLNSPINKVPGDNRWWSVLPSTPSVLPFHSWDSLYLTLLAQLSQLYSLSSTLSTQYL